MARRPRSPRNDERRPHPRWVGAASCCVRRLGVTSPECSSILAPRSDHEGRGPLTWLPKTTRIVGRAISGGCFGGWALTVAGTAPGRAPRRWRQHVQSRGEPAWSSAGLGRISTSRRGAAQRATRAGRVWSATPGDWRPRLDRGTGLGRAAVRSVPADEWGCFAHAGDKIRYGLDPSGYAARRLRRSVRARSPSSPIRGVEGPATRPPRHGAGRPAPRQPGRTARTRTRHPHPARPARRLSEELTVTIRPPARPLGSCPCSVHALVTTGSHPAAVS